MLWLVVIYRLDLSPSKSGKWRCRLRSPELKMWQSPGGNCYWLGGGEPNLTRLCIGVLWDLKGRCQNACISFVQIIRSTDQWNLFILYLLMFEKRHSLDELKQWNHGGCLFIEKAMKIPSSHGEFIWVCLNSLWIHTSQIPTWCKNPSDFDSADAEAFKLVKNTFSHLGNNVILIEILSVACVSLPEKKHVQQISAWKQLIFEKTY